MLAIPLIEIAVIIFMLVAMWKVFTKAGQPGWAIIVPIYNWYIMLKIGSKPGWWLILLFIPLVNIVIMFLTYLAIAQNFGKGTGFAVGLFFLGFIFFPILAFGDAQYILPEQTKNPDNAGPAEPAPTQSWRDR